MHDDLLHQERPTRLPPDATVACQAVVVCVASPNGARPGATSHRAVQHLLMCHDQGRLHTRLCCIGRSCTAQGNLPPTYLKIGKTIPAELGGCGGLVEVMPLSEIQAIPGFQTGIEPGTL
ncbi:Hypothetical predicted protein [Podarcis lilfordi]|uniref:Uncharacterized protein n=1 Tax=Podarcis lilfordi TaxID=74358 RepID=A0AA35KD39_9SAUR|nr:Hypothetical predicted protein [Podarcis lilfordi]